MLPGEFLEPAPPPPPPSLQQGVPSLPPDHSQNAVTMHPMKRPSSQLSHNGSSGYGSTRSQTGTSGRVDLPAVANNNRPSPDSTGSTGSSSGSTGHFSSSNGSQRSTSHNNPQFASLRYNQLSQGIGFYNNCR